jgi:enoyl-CoA hydratase
MILERSQHDLVQVLKLNRPEAANSLNPELIRELGKAFHEIATDDATQVVILTGAGEKIFCAGMDLKAFSDSGGASASGKGAEQSTAHPLDMKTLSAKPVIAAVNGAAVGGGFELVLSCDLVVAADNARFGLPEVKRGLLAADGGTLLGTRIPLSLALEVALTGELITAERASQWGLVNRVVAPFDLLDASLALAAAVAANGPLGIRTTKAIVRRAVLDDPKLGYGTPEEIAAVFRSEDAQEGAKAFLEKRAPHWTGR